jgi:hypothetical protein
MYILCPSFHDATVHFLPKHPRTKLTKLNLPDRIDIEQWCEC